MIIINDDLRSENNDIDDLFIRLPNLATLDMSRNKIVEIEQGAFEGAYSINEM